MVLHLVSHPTYQLAALPTLDTDVDCRGKYNNSAMSAENWGWLIEWTPAFIGVGILVGLNTAISFFMGSVLAWGIIGPTLVHYGVAFGTHLVPDDPQWGGYISYASLGTKATNKATPSPRFWLLWPGVLLMIVVSFTELFLQYKVFYFVGKAVYRGVTHGINDLLSKNKRTAGTQIEKVEYQKESDLVEDPARPDELVPW